jgi:thiol-disulfide isomerase/thioredoxin
MRNLLVAFLLIFAVGLLLAMNPANAELRQGQKIPAYTFTNLDGKEVKLGGKQNKVYIVDFWATWCGPCRKAIPFLQEMHTKYNKRGLEVVGVALSSGTQTEVKRFVEDNEMTYNVCVPTDTAVSGKYKVEAFPTLYIVDKQGYIRYAAVGYSEESDAEILKVVGDLLAE